MSKNTPKTELLYQKSKPIDHLSLSHGLFLMIKEQKDAALEVKRSIKSIEHAIEAIYKHLTLNSKGRLIYVGAGTSARIGVQDGVELFPTFNWPKERLDFIIAGGINALLNAIENAEDDLNQGWKDLKKHKISDKDIIIGIASSGTTPYVINALKKCKINGIYTVCITSNPSSPITKTSDIPIEIVLGPEFITGSSRMKSGTAQKMILNMISSATMIKLGHIKGNKMIDIQLTNNKLKKMQSAYHLNNKQTFFLNTETCEMGRRGKQIPTYEIMSALYQKNLQSVIIEGGSKTLQHFIDANLWDEARIFLVKKVLEKGVKAPRFQKDSSSKPNFIEEDQLLTLYRD